MKTNDLFRGVLMSLCAAVMATMMSCNVNKGNNPEPANSSDSTSEKKDSMSITTWYSFPTNEDMLDLFYINVEYLDGEGKMKSVTLDSDSWSISVKSTKLPVKLGMHVNITMKGMADLTKYESVAINYTASAISRVFDAQGNKVGKDYMHQVDIETNLSPVKVSLWAEEYAKHPVEFWYEFDEKGTYKETEK